MSIRRGQGARRRRGPATAAVTGPDTEEVAVVDFGGMADKAKEWAGKNPEKADSFVDKGGDAIEERTGHGEQIDQAGEKAKNYLHPDEQPPPGEPGEQAPPPPPQG